MFANLFDILVFFVIDFHTVVARFDNLLLKSGCQRKLGKMLKMSTEGGQQTKFLLTS